MRALHLLVLILCAFAPLAGCQSIPDSDLHPGLVKFTFGDLRSNLRASPRQVIAALERTLLEKGVPVLETRVDDIEGSLLARTAKDRKIDAEVRRRSPTVTWLRLRIGALGDKDLSREFHARMLELLKAPDA